MKSKLRIAIFTAAVTALLFTFGLTQKVGSLDGPLPPSEVEASTIDQASAGQSQTAEVAEVASAKPVQFVSYRLGGKRSIADLKSRFGEEGLLTILKINRVDQNNLRNGAELMVPTESRDLLDFSPYPREIDSVKDIPKLILVSRRVQAFAAYESGKLVWWGPTSTGKKSTQTPAGLFHTNWRAKITRSTVNRNWVLPWTFNLDNLDGIAFHQYALPGYPASHGCARLLESDAMWIYDWSDQWILSSADKSLLAYGTPVIIFGDYNYGQMPPWKHLAHDPLAASVTESEILTLLAKHLPTVEARTNERETVLATIAQAKVR